MADDGRDPLAEMFDPWAGKSIGEASKPRGFDTYWKQHESIVGGNTPEFLAKDEALVAKKEQFERKVAGEDDVPDPEFEDDQPIDWGPQPEPGTAVEPVLTYDGRQYSGVEGDFDNIATVFGAVSLGGPFSVAFTARWDSIQSWGKVIDWGDGEELRNVWIGTRDDSRTLIFHVWSKDMRGRLEIPNVVTAGEEHRYLCSCTPAGYMRVYKDGIKIGERKGAVPMVGPRGCMHVGMSCWDRDSPFHGSITNLQVWNATVDCEGKAVAECIDAFLPPDPRHGSAPIIKYFGREFRGEREDFDELGPEYAGISIGGAMSVAFTARWDNLGMWSHVVDFSNGIEQGNIFIGNRRDQDTLAMHVWNRSRETRFQIPKGIILGETHKYLLTVSAKGHMRAFRDGKQIGEKLDGRAPYKHCRSHLLFGKSAWPRDEPFKGFIEEVTVWNTTVDWEGAPIGEYPRFVGDTYVVDLSALNRDTEDFQGRDWLEHRIRARLPLAWDILWQPDERKSDNPVAFMQFASDDTVLLLRARGVSQYLPGIVKTALLSDTMTKVCANWSNAHQRKMQKSFGLQPRAIDSLMDMAHRKGIPEPDLEALALRMGYDMPPANDMSLFGMKKNVSTGIISSAADGAYLTFLLLDAICQLPDGLASQEDIAKIEAIKLAAPSEPVPTLAAGWQELFDEASNCSYYSNGQITQWDRPEPLDDSIPDQQASGSRPSKSAKARARASREAEEGPALPPGWREVWDATVGKNYYADMETQATQWKPPQRYDHGDWYQGLDDRGEAFWKSVRLNFAFFEQEPGEWRRLADFDGRTYWSNPEKGVRFFEQVGAASQAGGA